MRGGSLVERVDACKARFRRVEPAHISGTVTNLLGLVVEVEGLSGLAAAGDGLQLHTRDQRCVLAEVIGFRDAAVQAMAYGSLDGVAHGSRARLLDAQHGMLDVASSWLGRVIDPLAKPLDSKGILFGGATGRRSRNAPPEATLRARLGPRIDLGVRALNCFATCRQGQRLGLFAGSGVGKSTLLSMLTLGTECDVVVLALVGERGREVPGVHRDRSGTGRNGAFGGGRGDVGFATVDAPPVRLYGDDRRRAFSRPGTVGPVANGQRDTICLALREIGLSLGEPPATRGYPPSVFAELPRLLERAGPGLVRSDRPPGHITGLFTVLVEGDDHNEPVADAVRGILDGHIVMDRKIAEAGRYPAIDVLRSLSRLAASCLDAPQTETVGRARRILALQGDMADMVRLGAYRAGTDPAVDEALRLTPLIDEFLRQSKGDRSGFLESFERLDRALSGLPRDGSRLSPLEGLPQDGLNGG